jgi:glucosamine-6-phosphate deaminase
MGGIDIQVLGIGNNGHIGFNEPSDVFTKGTGVVDLTASTIDANSRFFASRDLVPTQALSMGIGQILAGSPALLPGIGFHQRAEVTARIAAGEVYFSGGLFVLGALVRFCHTYTSKSSTYFVP